MKIKPIDLVKSCSFPYLTIDEDGTWFCWETEPYIAGDGFWGSLSGDYFPINNIMIDYDGDWKNSLVIDQIRVKSFSQSIHEQTDQEEKKISTCLRSDKEQDEIIKEVLELEKNKFKHIPVNSMFLLGHLHAIESLEKLFKNYSRC